MAVHVLIGSHKQKDGGDLFGVRVNLASSSFSPSKGFKFFPVVAFEQPFQGNVGIQEQRFGADGVSPNSHFTNKGVRVPHDRILKEDRLSAGGTSRHCQDVAVVSLAPVTAEKAEKVKDKAILETHRAG